MKKILCILTIFIAVSLIGFNNSDGKNTSSNNLDSNQQSIFSKYKVPSNHMPKDGVVSNKDKAISIADTILYSIYGETINDSKPYEVTYEEKNQVWIIKGTLKKNEIGGVPNIIINKSDGKVLAVWHTK